MFSDQCHDILLPMLLQRDLKKLAKPTTRSDVFNFGVLLWEIAMRHLPWEGLERQQIEDTVKNAERLEISENLDDTLQKLICHCWRPDPEKRPQMNYVVNQLLRVKNLLKPKKLLKPEK